MLRKKSLIFFVIVAAVSLVIFRGHSAQVATGGQLFTGGMINGRYWKMMSHDDKLSYIIGYSDTVKFVLHIETKAEDFRSKEALYYSRQSTPNEIIDQVDLLLKDSSNNRLPIPALCYCAGKKMSGYPDPDVSSLLAKFRSIYYQMQ